MSAPGGTIVHLGRERLPDRRPNTTVRVAWREHEFDVTAGFFPDGRIGEAFARTSKPNSTLDTMLDEGCQLISRLLQRGCGLAEIIKGMTFDSGGCAETPLGAVARALMALEGSP